MELPLKESYKSMEIGEYRELIHHTEEGTIGERKWPSDRRFTPKVVLFKKSPRKAEPISTQTHFRVSLKSVDKSIIKR